MASLRNHSGTGPDEDAACLAAINLDENGSLSGQIKRSLVSLIISGRLKPRQRLPSDERLTARIGCSRMTVYQAMKSLADEGLIVRYRRRGSFVADAPVRNPVLAIQTIEDTVTGKGRKYDYRLLQRKLAPADKELAARLLCDAGSPALFVKSLHCADRRPVQLEERWINLDTVPDAREADFASVTPGRWLLKYVQWSDARHVIYAAAAAKPAADYLQVPPGHPCLILERLTRINNRSVTFARLKHPAEYLRLEASFSPSQKYAVG